MLKNVKLLFLNYKRINLPFGNVMNRAALIILFLCAGLSACKKSTEGGTAGYKAQARVDDAIIAKYLSENPTLEAKKVDTSGVYYIVEQPGTGSDLFTNSTSVTVGYTGSILSNGKVFAQTQSFHPSYILQSVILGWKLGIPKIQKGGTIRLLLPSRYAYGPAPQPQIGLPANAILDFTITLYDIVN
ncbi:hypothetical protein FO440_10275 [Mucilaginibacter corticis]|uniref:Peptidyl-prolyl cis-trans isomerase n=2 Tax=Mucilaginibacter corticis TaxID=2597670 RepID=A0A556MX89_9SPHI|nr:hypothetical protein FO440_10275 [Mucilaginibacter corticis]